MNRRSSTQPPDVPPGFALGSTFDVASWHGSEMFYDVSGRIHCIVGYKAKKQPLDLPYYYPSVAAKDPNGRTSYRFVELTRGTLANSGFLRSDGYYRHITDRWLVLPSGADSYFGVISKDKREEDVAATRQVFGGTAEDISRVAHTLAQLVGRGRRRVVRLPRVTFSKTRQNQCDFSGCLIPKDFPYVAFDESQYAWSHVSLHGFYHLLSFLCYTKSGNPLRTAMLESELPESILDALIENTEHYGQPLSYPDYLSDG
jgi:hypothetical protein